MEILVWSDFGSSELDFLTVARFDEALERHQSVPIIPYMQRDIYISWPNCCTGGTSHGFSIKVRVEKFEAYLHPFTHNGHQQLIRSWDYTKYWQYFCPDQSYAIVPDSMPSLDVLLDACPLSYHCCISGPLGRPNIALGIFAEKYCNSTDALPLV